MCWSWILKDRVRRPVMLHLLSNAKHCTAGTCPCTRSSAPCISPADPPTRLHNGQTPRPRAKTTRLSQILPQGQKGKSHRAFSVHILYASGFQHETKKWCLLNTSNSVNRLPTVWHSYLPSWLLPWVNSSVTWNLNHASSVRWSQNMIQNQFLPSPSTWGE